MRTNAPGGTSLVTLFCLHMTKMAKRDSLNVNIRPSIPSFTGNGDSLPSYAQAHYLPLTIIKPPIIRFEDIHEFMVDRKRENIDASGSEEEQSQRVRSYRTMDRAVAHFQAGDVQEIMFSQVDTDIVYGQALVLASMKKMRYRVWICFYNSKPVHAYCDCAIGLAQFCSHTGSLLFAINNFMMKESDPEVACTSRQSRWNVPRKITLDPKPLKEMVFNKPKMCQEIDPENTKSSVLSFDPRHPTQTTLDLDHYTAQMMELRKILPNTGMSHLAIIPDDPPQFSSEVTVESTRNPMEEKVTQIIYGENTSPLQLLNPIEPNLSDFIEEHTRGQRSCDLWRELHKGRITSSSFGDVLRAGPQPRTLIQRIVKGSNLDKYDTLPKAVKWGIEHEEDALADYLLLQNAVTSLSVSKSGLVLYPSHPFLGASTDGKVVDYSLPTSNMFGVLEIKCPYSLQGNLINEMEVYKIAEMGCKDFCLEVTSGRPRLRRDHKYYAQIQGEMAITSTTWCDFVVWTAAKDSNCFIERIEFDKDFVAKMFPKLVEFFVTHILKE